MSGLTVNFGFYLPVEGDGQDNGQPWASAINGNFASIDALLKGHADSIAGLQALGVRSSISATTTSLAPGETWNGTIALPKTSAALRLTTSRPATVRAYGSAAARTADSTRPPGQFPGAGTGLQFQGTTGAGLLSFTCQAPISNDDGTPAAIIYLAVTNKDTTTGTIDVTFSQVPLES